jgi:hypothetical protein
MPNKHRKVGFQMVTKPSVPERSAQDELLDSFGQLIDEAAEKMTGEKFQEAARKSTETLDRAIAAHSWRRGIA